MRTLKRYKPAVDLMKQSDEEITAALITRLTALSKRQARNAILHGTRMKLIQSVGYGKYRRSEPTAGAA